MKKIQESIFFFLFLISLLNLDAQTYNITFRVDMATYSGSIDTSVNVAGTFNSWTSSNPLRKKNNSNVWEGTIALSAGTYDYSYMIGDWTTRESSNGSCFSIWDTRTFTVTKSDTLPIVCWGQCTTCNILPLSISSVKDTICRGDSIVLYSLGGVRANAATWSPSSTLSSNTGDTVIAFPTATTEYTMTRGNLSVKRTIYVKNSPVLSVNFTDTLVCQGDSIKLTASAPGTNTYIWNNGISNGVFFKPETTAMYKVNVKGTNGCVSRSKINITVLESPKITITASDTLVCEATGVVLTASGAENNVYAWSDNVQNGIMFGAFVTKTYRVLGSNKNGCVGSAEIKITVKPAPTHNGIIGQKNNIQLSTVYTYSIDYNPEYTYNWSLDNGIILEGQGTNQVKVQFAANGQTTLSCQMSGLNSCKGYVILDLNVGSTGIAGSVDQSSFICYPNPVHGLYYIKSELLKGKTVFQLYNSLGHLMKSGTLLEGLNTIDMSNLSPGIYLLSVSDLNMKIRLIVQ